MFEKNDPNAEYHAASQDETIQNLKDEIHARTGRSAIKTASEIGRRESRTDRRTTEQS